jgi:selT/selW/selH-like putative selenoprotein
LAAEIKKQVGIEPQIVRGSGGIFVVTVDGEKIFSKHDAGRFPTESEIVATLKSRPAS